MLDKQLAAKLSPLTQDKILWEALLQHLTNLKTLELQALVVATSEQEMFRKQGKVNSLDNLMHLKKQITEARQRVED